MKASVLVGPKHCDFRDIDLPAVGPRDVLVRVKACGVCRSELEPWVLGNDGGRCPYVMGHEPSGVIEAVGAEVTALSAGQPVTMFTGRSGDFTDYTSGAYAEYVAVPAENIVPLPPSVPFELALGEPIACLVSAFERTNVTERDRVLLIGCGFMGLALLQLLKSRRPRELVAVDVSPEARELALRFGADRACAPGELSPVRWWKDGDAGFDVVVEVSGAQKALDLAGEVANAHATLSIVGYHAGMRQVDVGLWNVKGLTVINAHEKRRSYFLDCMRKGIGFIADGRLDMRSLVTHTYALSEVDRAFADLHDKTRGHTKGVILL